MKKLFCGPFFFFLFISCLLSSSYAQGAGNTVSGKIGVLGFSTASPAGWRVGADVDRKAGEILASESIEKNIAFATMFGTKGPIIFAIWTDFPPGFVVPAAQMAEGITDSAIPSDWKVLSGELRASTRTLSNRLEYAYWRLVAMGNGKQIGGSAGIKTLAVWIDIPVAYRDNGKVGAGVVSLFLRGAEADFKGPSKHSAEQFMISIAESLVPPGAEFVPFEVISANASEKAKKSQQAVQGSGVDSRQEAPSDISIEQAVDVMKQAIVNDNFSPSKLLSACMTIKRHMSWPQYSDFKSLNPELRRLESICENRLEKTILLTRINAEFSDTEKLKAYLTPMYQSAAAAGPVPWCDFLHYVDSVWEENDFKRPEKDQCPRKLRRTK